MQAEVLPTTQTLTSFHQGLGSAMLYETSLEIPCICLSYNFNKVYLHVFLQLLLLSTTTEYEKWR